MQTEQYEVNWKNYYDILGLSPTANAQEIKSAYRRQARKYHPDRAKDSIASDSMAEINEAYERLVHRHHSLSGTIIKQLFSAIMVDINEAYEVLSNPVRRARYDQVFKVKHYSQAVKAKKPTKEETIGLVVVIAQVAQWVIRELRKNRRVPGWSKVSKRVAWAAVLSLLLIMVGGTSLAFEQPDNIVATPFRGVASTVAEEALAAISLIEEARGVAASYERSIVSTQLQAMRVIEGVSEVPPVTAPTNDMAQFPSPNQPLFPNYLEGHSQFRYTVDSRGNVSVDTSVATTDPLLDKIKQLLIRLAAGAQTAGSSPPVTSPPVTSIPVRGSIPPAETALEYRQRGIALTNEGHYEQAIAEFNKAIELDPNRFTAYYGRGLAYKAQGKKNEAIADFEKVISLIDNRQIMELARQEIEKLGARTVASSPPVANPPTLTPTPVPTAPPTLTHTPAERSEVHFPNADLEAAIREAISKSEGPIYTSSLEGLRSLDASEKSITDLSGIEHCTKLTSLDLGRNQISDLCPLASLTNLTWLYLGSNRISDLCPLASFTKLNKLYLAHNQISDISPLVENSGLTKGDQVWLRQNNLDLWEGSEDLESIRQLERRGVIVHY